MKHILYTTLATACLFATTSAHAAKEVPAKLAGHAILPAKTFLTTPSDAAKDLKISGKFTTDKRIDQPNSLTAYSGKRPTDLKLPFSGQPVQGHSGIKVMPDGTVWLLTDNGFGNKKNSTDAMLFLRQYRVDWKTGKLNPLKTVFLHDPDHNIPFRIVNESSPNRYLTGGDFDPESIQISKDRLWIGEEFGPYLIEADLNGKVLKVYPLELNGKKIQSPDNPHLTMPAKPDTNKMSFNIKRSKGFEGMAMSPDGRYLYPLLEGPIFDEATQKYEQANGKTVLRIFEFDTANKRYTGNTWLYPLESTEHAIGDFNMIDPSHGLIIERDNLEGTAAYPCKTQDITQCFDRPAKFKRIYKIALKRNQTNQPVEKLAYIDLMNISDPKRISRKPLVNGKFVFPFFTIENVDVVDGRHIIVGNDNNLPFSSSRHPNQVDDNELILLDVGNFLKP